MMPGSDDESGTQNVLVSSIKQEPVDWIIEENINSDEDDVSSNHLNTLVKKELDETVVIRPKLKQNCSSKQTAKISKAARFNSLIANLKEKALSKQCNNELVSDTSSQNSSNNTEQYFSKGVLEGRQGNLKIKEEHYDLNDGNVGHVPSQTSTTSADSLSSRLSKQIEPLQNTSRISDLTLRNMLNNVPTIRTNTSHSDSAECLDNDFKTPLTFSDKSWLPRLTELIKSKPKACCNGEDIKVSSLASNSSTSDKNTKYDQLLKDLVSQHTEETFKVDRKKESCPKMLTSKTLSSLLAAKTNEPEQNTEDLLDYHYNCQECNRSFGTFSSLIAHKKYHRLKQKLVCTTCKKEFSVKRDFERHLKKHDSPVEHTCSVCDKNFSVIGALKRHMLIHRQQPTKEDKFYTDDLYGEGVEECPICGDKFSKYYIKYHMKIHSSDRPYTCKICEKSFTHKQSLVAHRLKHKRESVVWKCKFCDRVFDYEYLLKRHMKLHTKYKCDKCDKTLRNKASYLSHWRTHNTSSYQCDVCNRTYSRYSAYFSHYQSHKDVGNLPLPENTASLISESSANDDLINSNVDKCDGQIHDDQNLPAIYGGGSNLVSRVIAEQYDFDDPVQPGVCKGENESMSIPNTEAGRYSQTANTCPVCKWDAISPCALKRHMRVHEPKGTKGDKDLVDKLYKEGVQECPVCGDKFSRYYIKYHMKIHSSDRPYSCDKCEKAFAHKSSLVAHVLTHQRETLVWYCDFCERGFEYEYLFKRHMKTHSSNKDESNSSKKVKNLSLRKALETGVSSNTFFPEPSIEIENVEDGVENARKEFLINEVISSMFGDLSSKKDNFVTSASTGTGRMEGGLPDGLDGNEYSLNNAEADKCDDDEESDSLINADADQTFIDRMLYGIRDGEETATVNSEDHVSKDGLHPVFSDSESHLVVSNNEVLTSDNEDCDNDIDLPVQFGTG